MQCTPFLVGPLHLVLFWTPFSPHAAWNWKHHSGLDVEWPSGLLVQQGSTSTGALQAKQVFLFPLLGSALAAIDGSGASLSTEECCAGGGEDTETPGKQPWWFSHKLEGQKTQTAFSAPGFTTSLPVGFKHPEAAPPSPPTPGRRKALHSFPWQRCGSWEAGGGELQTAEPWNTCMRSLESPVCRAPEHQCADPRNMSTKNTSPDVDLLLPLSHPRICQNGSALPWPLLHPFHYRPASPSVPARGMSLVHE